MWKGGPLISADAITLAAATSVTDTCFETDATYCTHARAR